MTPATDVYALGLILIEALTGRPAIQGDTVWSVLAVQNSKEPIRLSRTLLDHELGPILRKAVEKEPSDRFVDAADMLAALPDAIEGGSLPLFATGPAPAASLASRRRRLGLIVAAVAIVGLGAATVAVVAGGDEPTENAVQSLPIDDGNGVTQPAAVDMPRRPPECGAEHPLLCVSLLDNAEADEEAASNAFEVLAAACSRGHAEACVRAGYAAAGGPESLRDGTRAVTLLERACQMEQAMGCLGLGATLLSLQDFGQAAAAYGRACDLGELEACANRANLLHRGQGVVADPEAAVALYNRACSGGVAVACTGLATLYQQGLVPGADPSIASDLYRRACELGEPIACYNLAVGGSLTSDDERMGYLRRACEGGHEPACERRQQMEQRH